MTGFADLPPEILEHILTFVRPESQHLSVDELCNLARLRLVNKAFAEFLTTDTILHAVYLSISKSNKTSTILFACNLARCKTQSCIRDLVIHVIQGSGSADTRILETGFPKTCNQIERLTFFSAGGSEPLLCVTQLARLRHLAVNCEYACFLPNIIAQLRQLQSLALYPVHKAGKAPNERHPSCSAKLFPAGYRVLLSKSKRLDTLHYEEANATCMLGIMEMLPAQPVNLSLGLNGKHQDLGAERLAGILEKTSQWTKRLTSLRISGLDDMKDGEIGRAALQSLAASKGFVLKEQKSSTRPSWIKLPEL